jgi:hypothetical protein
MIQWRPATESHYFEVLAERAAYHRYGDAVRGWGLGSESGAHLQKAAFVCPFRLFSALKGRRASQLRASVTSVSQTHRIPASVNGFPTVTGGA